MLFGAPPPQMLVRWLRLGGMLFGDQPPDMLLMWLQLLPVLSLPSPLLVEPRLVVLVLQHLPHLVVLVLPPPRLVAVKCPRDQR